MLKKFLDKHLPDPIKIHLQAVDHYLNGEPELRILHRVCDRSRTALDIGANIGIYTYFLRRHSSKVHAYEPNPELAARLQRLFHDVTVHNAACSDRMGSLILRIPIENGRAQHELASVSQNFEDVHEIVSYQVPAVTIDSEGVNDVGFIKIDVEQHERQVLQGAIKTIRRWRPNIIVEVTPLLYSRSLPAEFEFLTAEGYDGWFRFGKTYHHFSDFRQQVHANPATWRKSSMAANVFFTPKEHHIFDA
jgi:FkbM family methyltransferase